MQFKKTLPILGAGLILALTLAGCSSADAPAKTKAPTSSSSTAPAKDSSTKPAPKDEKPATSKDGVITFSGQGEKDATTGEYAHYPVEIAVKVGSIEKISTAEHDALYAVAKPDQQKAFDAFDLYKVNYTETYVSGNDPKYQATYTSYKAVDKDGVKITGLAVIGFDWCKSNSFTKDFVTGTPNDSCILAAVAKGGAAPAGIQFSQYGTPSEKTPIVILK